MPKNTVIVAGQPSRPSGGKGSTPMMEQFWRAKKEQPDALLFFRMGDFYELFHEDAEVAARELSITLTSRSKGEGAYAMAGVPVKSVEGYLLRLVRKGFKVAICEQLGDPRTTRGIVERGIVRVVTPGTLTEEDVLDARENNYLAAIALAGEAAGIAWVDLSTGRLQVAEIAAAELADELGRIAPAELLWSPASDERHPELSAGVRRLLGGGLTERDPWRFEPETALRALKKHFGLATLEGFGVADDSLIVPAAGALIEYLQETQRGACEHVGAMERVESSGLLVLDRATRSCLELVRTQREGRVEGTLLATIDATLTPMGSRMLRGWVLSPLSEVAPILRRQQGVSELVDQPFLREDARARLGGIRDIERLVAKTSTGRANGRDLVGLAGSLEPVGPLKAALAGVYSAALSKLTDELDSLEDVIGEIRSTLSDEPPIGLREGGMIRDGHSKRLDDLRRIAGDGKSWMARFQAEEAERTGISGLKIGFNSVFGYFIEVPRGQVSSAPEHYIRKQTIKSAERYITPELKEFETEVLKAEETAKDLEYDLFCELREAVAAEVRRILETARAVAEIDALAALAQHSADHRYAPPQIDESEVIEITDGRHPVIELACDGEPFVPNDSLLDREGSLVTILTGPNMAGKSTYIRQTALIVLLAQIGSHVPAAKARIGIVDRIFTRIGSADDIGRGASTFMVEMIEIANILNNAGERSLVVLDEVGRGTSTFDGLALAWAIVEHVHEKVGARTMFATHYHQLTDLSERLRGVCNKTVAVREWEEEILFLHKIIDGGTDRSYGIHVARLAGVPAGVLERARAILADIEDDAEHLAPRIASGAEASAQSAPGSGQLSLFASGPSPAERRLAELDVQNMTPLQALNELEALRDLLD
ncbi:MAG: DNA mismatch repair protein MutS [Planctomycetota bacterium]|jgi:DNA mismatch repair protein MutS|nr:DNA mismatch repair protein MutS [Planctomycetota bacterium]MDP6989185.1 DNA mismatch repair protein MutS [Planctomycetota bacterium]